MSKTPIPEVASAVRIQRLKPHEFEAIRRLAYEKFGLDLRKGKEDLVAARLGKRMRALGLQT
ncbi:MAG: hypothetical protein ABSE73_07045, partial [Planctomycetota bacterium]